MFIEERLEKLESLYSEIIKKLNVLEDSQQEIKLSL